MRAVRGVHEIDDEPRDVPRNEPDLGVVWQAVEQVRTAKNSDEARDPRQRRPELAFGGRARVGAT